MAGDKHTPEAIAAKMAQADEMTARGAKRREISEALGVSIMTYHRWKKRMNSAEAFAGNNRHSSVEKKPQTMADAHSSERIKWLELENSQFRQILADILLDKHKLEVELRVVSAVAASQARKEKLT